MVRQDKQAPSGNGRRASACLHARGADGSLTTASGTETMAVFSSLGQPVVAPKDTGAFRPVSALEINVLDPELIIPVASAAKIVLALSV